MKIHVVTINNARKIKKEVLLNFQKKEISDENKLFEHCFAYYSLDKILSDIYKIENYEVEFINKKPYLKSRTKYFSISHSEEYLVIAISDFECGIDIEKIKKRDFVAISKRMKFSCDKLEDFYKEWTKFEARYKLGKDVQAFYAQKLENYIMTAVSENTDEKFEIIF